MTIVSRSKRALKVSIALLVGLALFATACGIPEDDAAVQIPTAALPAELVGGPILPPDATEGATDRIIWMVDEEDILVSVIRAIETTPDAAMDALLAGTFPAEREVGISSAIPRGTGYNPPIAVDETSQIAFVDLTAGSLQSLGREEREVAYAQIVTSLDELATISRVNFTIDGQFISVQTSDGATTPGQAVSRADFASHQRVRPSFEEPVLETEDTTPTPVPTPVDTRSELAVWMFDTGGRLVRVSRLVDFSPENIMESVLGGPTIPESEAGITTALAPEAIYVGLDIDETTQTALVDLTPVSLPPLAGDQKLRAVAQIVYSLTELTSISGVLISIDGVRQAMPTDVGIVEGGTVLRREDFAALAPPATGPDVVEEPASTPGTPDEGTDQGNDQGTDDDSGDAATPSDTGEADAAGTEPTDPAEPPGDTDAPAEDTAEPGEEQGPEAPSATPEP